MDPATDSLLALLALQPVRASLADPRPTWLLNAETKDIVYTNRAGARLLGTAAAARFAPMPGGALALQVLNRATVSPLLALRLNSHLVAGALQAQATTLDTVDGAELVFVVGLKPLPKPEADAYSLDDLLAVLRETEAIFGLYDADSEPIDIEGPKPLLDAAFDTAFPDPLDTLGAQPEPRTLTASIGSAHFEGTAYPLPGFDRMLFLIIGAMSETVPEAEAADRVLSLPQAGSSASGSAGVDIDRFVFETDRRGRIVFTSDNAAALLTGLPDGPIGHYLEELCDPRDLTGQASLSGIVAGLQPFSDVVVLLPTADGEALLRLAGVPTFDPPGTISGYRGVGLIEHDSPSTLPQPAASSSDDDEWEPAPFDEADWVDDEFFDRLDTAAGLEPSDDDIREEDLDAVLNELAETAHPPQDDAKPSDGRPSHSEEKTDRETAENPANVVRLRHPTLPKPRALEPKDAEALDRIAETIETAIGNDTPAVRTTPPAPTSESNDAQGQKKDAEASSQPATVVNHPNAVTMAEQAALLERLPLGLVIFRSDDIAYANRAFFDLLDYRDLSELREAGGLDAIFAMLPVPGLQAFDDEPARQAFQVRDSKGQTLDVVARLQSIPYGGETCMLLSMRQATGATTVRHEPSAAAQGKINDDLVTLLDDTTEDVNAARIEELNTIIDTATDGIVVINADGTIDRLNAGAESLFGYANAEIAGQPLTALFTPDSHAEAEDYLADLAQNGVASLLNDGREMTGQFKTGGAIPLFVTVGRVSMESDSKFCAVLRDITHFKSAETELIRARQRAEDASAQKSEFLAKISHEIRTPLNSIIGFSEVMMNEEFGAMSNDRYKAYARDIHQGGNHLLSLINDLLDLSKIEAGKLDLDFASVEVNDLIQQCVAIMQPDANRERLIVRTNLPPSTPPVVADARSLRQIILNVLSNSIKFTPPGGQIIATTKLNERGEVVVALRDTGVGMSDAELETALEPFRQVATAARNRTGTGLGLPLTKAMAEANRAQFDIDSDPGNGTTVRITFPVTRVLAE